MTEDVRTEALRQQALLQQQLMREQAAPERGIRQVIYDNLIGDPNDGVNSFGERLGTWLNRAGESMTLGTVGDEAAAAVTGMLPGRSYDEELERYRQNEENMTGLGRTSADLFGAIAPAALGVGAVTSAPTLGSAVVRGLGFGATAGGLQGFAEGEGGLANRTNSGLVGAGIGGALGAGIPAAGALAGQVYRGAQGALRNSRVGREIGDAFGVSRESGTVLGQLIGESNPDDMIASVNRGGQSAMLADAAPGTRGALDGAMRSPMPGAALARSRVDNRAAEAGYGLMDALNGGQLGPRIPPVANQAARAAAARPVIHPLYEAAYRTPIDYDTPAGRAVESILTRAPRRLVRSAVEAAQERMIYDGFPDQQIMARIGDDGSVIFDEMPNTMMADYIRRAFDEVAEGSRDSITGRMTPEGQFANRVARDLRNALADAVPGYDEALSAASSDIRERGAVRFGQRVLRGETTVEDVVSEIADATPAELRAMRQGVIAQMDHTLGNVRAIASDPAIDARQAVRALGDMGSPNSRQKLQALFGDEWPQIEQRLDEASQALFLRASVAGNSSTQPRQAFDALVSEAVAPGPVRSLEPVGSVRQLGQRAIGSDPASIARLSGQVRGELADVLTRPAGEREVRQIVSTLLRNPLPANTGSGVRAGVTGAGFTALPSATERVREILGMPLRR